MSVLPDWIIERDVKIEPLSYGVKRPGVISFGTTSFGYDARAGDVWKVFVDPKDSDGWHGGVYQPDLVIDPKSFDPSLLTKLPVAEDKTGRYVVIPPNTVALGETIEHFTIPRNVLCIVVGKSTYARCGLIVNVTPGEPEWRGKWTIEVSNTTPLPVKLYCGEGIMQCVFHRGEWPCVTSYADKQGKYQDQTGLTLPVVL